MSLNDKRTFLKLEGFGPFTDQDVTLAKFDAYVVKYAIYANPAKYVNQGQFINDVIISVVIMLYFGQ